MAVVEYTIRVDEDGTETVVWEGLTTNDTGRPYKCPGRPDKTYHIFGSFGGTGVVTMKGSNDPRVITAFGSAASFTLKDPSGSDIAPTAAGGGLIHPNPVYIWPAVTLGTNPDIDVHIVSVNKKG